MLDTIFDYYTGDYALVYGKFSASEFERLAGDKVCMSLREVKAIELIK